jgi:hypothetical protein
VFITEIVKMKWMNMFFEGTDPSKPPNAVGGRK